MGRSRTNFGRRYCCSSRKRKNGSDYLAGVSWPSAGKLVPALKVSELPVIGGQKVVCSWILSWRCCLPSLRNLFFQSLPLPSHPLSLPSFLTYFFRDRSWSRIERWPISKQSKPMFSLEGFSFVYYASYWFSVNSFLLLKYSLKFVFPIGNRHL